MTDFNPVNCRKYPSRWPLIRGKELFRVVDNRSETGTEELLTVSHITGITPRSQKNVTMFQAESLAGYKLCEIGDIAANTMWMWQGAIGVSKYAGLISPGYDVYRQKGSHYNPRYLDILLREKHLVDVYHSLSTGIRPSRLRLYPDVFLTIRFPVPPRTEQDQIVRFLDWKVSAINRLIGIKRKEIVALEELKQCQINEAIADIENLGDTMQRLKTFSSCNQLTLGDSTAPNYTFRYVDIGSVDAKKGITKYEQMVFSSAPSRARRIVRKDDIIISTVRTYLRAITKISDEDNVIVSTGFAVITAKNEYSKYIEYCFKTDRFCNEVVRCSIGIAYPSINTPVLMNLSIPIPNYDTQISTANRLDDISKKIDKQIENKEKYIISLAELKTRLIADTVTGKIDVRNIEIPEYEIVGEESQAEEEIDAEGSDNGE